MKTCPSFYDSSFTKMLRTCCPELLNDIDDQYHYTGLEKLVVDIEKLVVDIESK